MNDCVMSRRKNNLFTHLFIPTFERYLSKLGVAVSNEVKCHQVLKKCSSMFMHAYWSLEWVVMHAPGNTDDKVKRYLQKLPARKNISNTKDDLEQAVSQVDHVELNLKFLEICMAIADNDMPFLRSHLDNFTDKINETNICFGTTILAYAIHCGNLEPLRLLLNRIGPVRKNQAHIYMRIALTCQSNKGWVTRLLLDKFSTHFSSYIFPTLKVLTCFHQTSLYAHFAPASITGEFFRKVAETARSQRDFAENLVRVAWREWSSFGVNTVLAWVATLEYFYERLELMEDIWGSRIARCEWRHQPLPVLPPPSEKPLREDVSDILPAVVKKEVGDADDADGETLAVEAEQRYRPMPNAIIFAMVRMRSLAGIEWLLWAGADPRSYAYQQTILELAEKESRMRMEDVARLLDRYGWDCKKLSMR